MIRKHTVAAAALCLLSGFPALAGEPAQLVQGQTVYVPVYSHIAHGNIDRSGKPATLLLSAMLSIRNVDPAQSISVRSVRYYDNDGKLLREYYAEPKVLGPLASTEVFVEHRDTAGGAGANFLVSWQADQPVNAPIIETVNAYFFGTQSVVFTSPGRPIRPSP
jgi:hypothetical protein